jgi:hypothetical protein
MNTAELDRLFQQTAKRIVSVEITARRGPLPRINGMTSARWSRPWRDRSLDAFASC